MEQVWITVIGMVWSVAVSGVQIDRGLVDGIQEGDRAEIFYVLKVAGEEKRIEIGEGEVTRVEDEAAVVSVPDTSKVKPGYRVQFRIPEERTAPTRLLELAKVREDAGQLESAVIFLKRLEESMPDDLLVQNRLQRIRDKQDAEARRQQELKRVPFYHAAAREFLDEGDAQSARSYTDRILSLVPDDATARNLLAEIEQIESDTVEGPIGEEQPIESDTVEVAIAAEQTTESDQAEATMAEEQSIESERVEGPIGEEQPKEIDRVEAPMAEKQSIESDLAEVQIAEEQPIESDRVEVPMAEEQTIESDRVEVPMAEEQTKEIERVEVQMAEEQNREEEPERSRQGEFGEEHGKEAAEEAHEAEAPQGDEVEREPFEGMLQVASGTYEVGLDLDQAKTYNQTPRFSAELDSYWIDTEIVTIGQVAGAPEADVFGSTNLAAPAVGISVAEAEAYCQARGKRLPTEFEWEVAAVLDLIRTTSVIEWTSSDYQPYPGNTVHEEQYEGRFRVLRGPENQTRYFIDPSATDERIGFRCAADGER